MIDQTSAVELVEAPIAPTAGIQARPLITRADRTGWSLTGSWLHLALIPLCLITFFMHFRPWGGMLVEDWDFAFYYRDWGLWGTITSPLAWQFLGRPFAVPWNVIGFGISDGAAWGPFLLLGLLSVAQLLATLWALRTVVSADWIRLALAVAVGLNPWWDAGLILRFIHGQAAVLALVLWVGVVVRWLQRGRPVWLVLAFLLPVLALLSYQATAVAIGVGAVALVFAVTSTVGRKWAALISSGVGVVLAMAWSAIIAPRIVGGGYMASVGSNYAGIGQSLLSSVNMIRAFVPGLFVTLALLLVTVIYLAVKAYIPRSTAAVFAAMLLATPLTPLVFITDYGWMNDPERTSQPLSMSLWFIACAIAAAACGWENRRSPEEARNWAIGQGVVAGLIIATSIIGTAVNYHVYSRIERDNQLLLTEVSNVLNRNPVTTEPGLGVPCFPDGGQLCSVVVIDDSGEFGQIYSLGFPSLSNASDTLFREPLTPTTLRATMCTPAAVLNERHEALVARGPVHQRDVIRNLTCEELLASEEVEQLAEIHLANGAELRVVEVSGTSPAAHVTPHDPNMPTESNEDDFWWWISDEPESFSIDHVERSIAGLQFQIWAPACAPTTATVSVTGGGQTETFDVDLPQAERTTLEVAFPHPTDDVELTVTPHTPSCQVPGDPRSFGPAFANLDLEWAQ